MQNAKSKNDGARKFLKNDDLMWDNAFSGVGSQDFTVKQAFATAKGFINFALCILKRPVKLQFENLQKIYAPPVTAVIILRYSR